MSGELNLQTLMRTLTCVLDDDLYVFATCEDRQVPEGIPFRMKFEEAEGTTLILTRDVAEKLKVDLVIVGTVARDGIKGRVVGNTCERLLDQTHSDLLVLNQ